MKGPLQTMTVLWGAFSVTPLMYLVVLFTVPGADGETTPIMPAVLGAISLGLVYVGVIFERSGFARAMSKANVKIEERSFDAQAGGFRQAAPTQKVIVTKVDDAIRSTLPFYQTPFILAVALAEAIVIFGFLLGFLGYSVPIIAPFFAVGWLLILLRMPRPTRFVAAIEKRNRAIFVS